MKILIPIMNNNSFQSEISLHFGHAPFFVVYDSEEENLEIFKNDLNHSNPKSSPVAQLINYNFNSIYVKDIGQRAINLFKEKNIKLKTGDYKIIQEVVDNLDSLKELEKGCGH
jgi:predicted Fe-Mo cluster-binding NifX family protein